MFKKITATLCLLLFFETIIVAQQKATLLVFSKTSGFRHKSIEPAQERFKIWAEKENWDLIFSEDTNFLNDTNLSKTDVLVFLNTTETVTDDASRVAIKKFMNKRLIRSAKYCIKFFFT